MFKFLLLLLLPSTFLATCCLCGSLLVIFGGKRLRLQYVGKTVLGLGAVGFAAVLVLPLDLWLLRPLEDRFPRQEQPQYVQGIVVLGGAIAAGVSKDRKLAVLNADADRLVAFVSLAHLYPDAQLVFAGGPPATPQSGLTEAEATRMLLQQLGVPPRRVLYEEQSKTTWENAVNALALAHPKPGETWLLITSASHMPRAVGAFRGAGWPSSSLIPWPVAYRTTTNGWVAPFQPVSRRLADLDLAAHEWAGLVGYWFQGHTDQLLPGP